MEVAVVFSVLSSVLLFGLKHMVKPLVNSHKELITTLKETNKANTEINRMNSESLAKLTMLVQSESERLSRIEKDVNHLKYEV